MAGLYKGGKRYYARIRMPIGSTPGEKRIPLGTSDEKVARARRIEVEKYEADIKAGLDISFPWLNKSGTTHVRHYSIKEAAKDYLKAREAENIRSSTIEIYELALNHFMKSAGRNLPISQIELTHIDKFKKDALIKLSATTVNIRLRSIKTFLFWLYDRGKLKKVPKIKQVSVANSPPIYISDSEFKRICNHTSPYLARVFNFYRDTGCRLREPFYADLNGSFLTIRAETAKGNRSRDIFLNDEQISTYHEMIKGTHSFEIVSSAQRPIRNTHGIKFYSSEFQKVCKLALVGGKKFHSLRHTFAVREYLRTRDIYHVARALGHASVTTTEIYAKFHLKRLEQDFPTLIDAQFASNRKRFGT